MCVCVWIYVLKLYLLMHIMYNEITLIKRGIKLKEVTNHVHICTYVYRYIFPKYSQPRILDVIFIFATISYSSTINIG